MAERLERPDRRPSEGPLVADEARGSRAADTRWPYAHLSEEPSDEELAQLDADLQDALAKTPSRRPFSFTVVFAPFAGPAYEQAVQLARTSSDYIETGTGSRLRHRARFRLDQAASMHRMWELVGTDAGSEVLVDDRPVPYARELWLPLLWYLLPR